MNTPSTPRMCSSCRRTYHAKKGRTCGTCRRRRRIANGAQGVLCIQCGERRAHVGRLRCHVCRAGGHAAWVEQKRRARRLGAARAGRPFRDLATRHAQHIAKSEAAAHARAQRERIRQFRALTLRLVMTLGRSRAAARYWIRYQSDAAFRAVEIARVRARKRLLVACRVRDGSLSLAEERHLRATAKCCHYCGEALTSANRTLDHVIPLSRGGSHTRRNVVPCCRRCNSDKGQRLSFARRGAKARAIGAAATAKHR